MTSFTSKPYRFHHPVDLLIGHLVVNRNGDQTMGDLVGHGKVFFVLRMGCVNLLPVARLSIVNPRVDSSFVKDATKPFWVFGQQAILVPCMVGARSDLWNGH